MVAIIPAGPQPQQPLLPGHRSLQSSVPTAVVFDNGTQRTLEIIWFSYHGAPHRYHTLPPGGTALQLTFTAHPWSWRDPADESALCTVDGQAVFYAPPHPHRAGTPLPRAVIREAERQPWAPAHHLHTPPAFRRQVRALLLCHHRLARGQAGGQQGQQVEQTGRWRERLRSATLCARQPPQVQQQSAEVVLTEQEENAPQLCHLPQELLMMVVAAAAPEVPVLLKPSLPHGVNPQDVAAEVQERLFRPSAERDEGSDASGHSSVGSAMPRQYQLQREEQRRVPAQQVWGLVQQQQDPRPPPLAAVAHPLLGQPLG